MLKWEDRLVRNGLIVKKLLDRVSFEGIYLEDGHLIHVYLPNVIVCLIVGGDLEQENKKRRISLESVMTRTSILTNFKIQPASDICAGFSSRNTSTKNLGRCERVMREFIASINEAKRRINKAGIPPGWYWTSYPLIDIGDDVNSIF